MTKDPKEAGITAGTLIFNKKVVSNGLDIRVKDNQADRTINPTEPIAT